MTARTLSNPVRDAPVSLPYFMKRETGAQQRDAMLEEHDEQLLLDHPRRVVERQQIGERVVVALRLLQHAVLIQTGDQTDRLRHQPGRRLARGVKHAKGLKDRGPVRGPLFVFRHGQAHGQESPRGPHLVIPFLHVTGLAGRRRGAGGKDAVALEFVPHPVL